MKEIKIFVSHRLDKDSFCIKNDLFQNVKCGSYYADSIPAEYVRDDVGENISHKRFSYNELTVQYFAWKNYNLDYYGLCHYRRFLSFFTEGKEVHHDLYGFITENGWIMIH